jgi:hypothetical protein
VNDNGIAVGQSEEKSEESTTETWKQNRRESGHQDRHMFDDESVAFRARKTPQFEQSIRKRCALIHM